ncbi:ABC transporter substrate-binding protein [Nocardia abscessus]|uniref:ABC transporter substrate-binding protein n=1 Tax=Nocardia abscessus TaxID=120957 RepID=UPI00189326CB|nr:ABC transporter substrate-binding protein [Nocardia abscessus]MBF6338430.1 ABC transporter substrate-binding protein [Nocardia abscessus]
MSDPIVVPRPRRRRWVLAAGVVFAVAVGLVAALVVVPNVVAWTERCGDGVSRVGPHDECVGLTDGSVVFAPELADVEERIRKENSDVIERGADYVSVVVLLPMTVREDDVVSAAWVRHHLEGAHLAQLAANKERRTGNTPLIRLLLANAGSGLTQWRAALEELEQRRAEERIVTVTGIGLSVDNAVHAMQRLAQLPMPMIGSTVTAHPLAGVSGFLRVAPTNAALAQAAANYAVGTGAKRVVLVRDRNPHDHYSVTLGDEFAKYLGDEFTGHTEPYNSLNSGVDNTFPHMMPNICHAAPDVVFFAGRARHATTFIQALAARNCRDKPIKVLTGDDMTFSPIPDHAVGTALSTGVSVFFTELAHPQAWDGAPPNIFNPASIKQFGDECEGEVCYRHLSADLLDDAVAIIAYDSVLTAVQAIRRAAGNEGHKVTAGDVLQTLPRLRGQTAVQGASGMMSFDESGNPVDKPVAMLKLLPDQPPKFEGLAWPGS